MSLKLLFIAVTWIVVTAALVGMTYRLPEMKSKDARQFWMLLLVSTYAGWACFNLHAQHKERVERRRLEAIPVTRTLSKGATEYQGTIFDGEIVYSENSNGTLFDAVSIRVSELETLVAHSVPSKYAGKEVVISNGRYADKKRETMSEAK